MFCSYLLSRFFLFHFEFSSVFLNPNTSFAIARSIADFLISFLEIKKTHHTTPQISYICLLHFSSPRHEHILNLAAHGFSNRHLGGCLFSAYIILLKKQTLHLPLSSVQRHLGSSARQFEKCHQRVPPDPHIYPLQSFLFCFPQKSNTRPLT